MLVEEDAKGLNFFFFVLLPLRVLFFRLGEANGFGSSYIIIS